MFSPRNLLIGGLSLLVLMLAINLGLNHYQALKAQISQLSQDKTELRDKLANRDALLTLANNALDEERADSLRLRQQQQNLNQQAFANAQHLKELLRENQQLKDWARVELPSAAQCLRNRPAISGADSYQTWLSSRTTVSAACTATEKQR